MSNTNANLRAVIWDIGGVILRTTDWTPRQRLAERFGLDGMQLHDQVFLSESSRQAELGIISADEHWQRVLKELGAGTEDIASFREQFFSGDTADTLLVETIHTLRPSYRTGLLSNAWSSARQFLQNNYHFLDAFDITIFSAEVGLVKPDPAIYHLALQKLGVAAREAVFIDDNLQNIEAARNLGMLGIHFKSTPQTLAELNKLL